MESGLKRKILKYQMILNKKLFVIPLLNASNRPYYEPHSICDVYLAIKLDFLIILDRCSSLNRNVMFRIWNRNLRVIECSFYLFVY